MVCQATKVLLLCGARVSSDMATPHNTQYTDHIRDPNPFISQPINIQCCQIDATPSSIEGIEDKSNTVFLIDLPFATKVNQKCKYTLSLKCDTGAEKNVYEKEYSCNANLSQNITIPRCIMMSSY